MLQKNQDSFLEVLFIARKENNISLYSTVRVASDIKIQSKNQVEFLLI